MGRKSSQRIEEILKGGDRRKLGATAPAQGLCLEEVYYSSERLNQALVALEAGLDTV
jgi:tRNA pseudouridine synthase A